MWNKLKLGLVAILVNVQRQVNCETGDLNADLNGDLVIDGLVIVDLSSVFIVLFILDSLQLQKLLKKGRSFVYKGRCVYIDANFTLKITRIHIDFLIN